MEARIFDEVIKKSVYVKQTGECEGKIISNCPLCSIGHDFNKTKISKLEEMDADHVAAWSKRGVTSIENCQMLCKTHNRAKGNNRWHTVKYKPSVLQTALLSGSNLNIKN